MDVTRDLAEISTVIYRYSLAMDTQDWPLMDQIFTPDAEIFLGEMRFASRRNGVAAIRACIDCCSVTHHMNSNIIATIDRDHAAVISNFRAWHRGCSDRSAETFEALGHYHDEFVRTTQGWRIARRRETSPIIFGDLSFFSSAAPRIVELAESASASTFGR